ncbi:hypothetical protein CsatB_025188 [Cannabis sativa]
MMMRRNNIMGSLVLGIVFVIIMNINIGFSEGGRVMIIIRDINYDDVNNNNNHNNNINILRSSLQAGLNKPPSPNPTQPASINQRNFAGARLPGRHAPAANSA